jgi:hypothetical protein
VTAFARIWKWEPGARSVGLLVLVVGAVYLVPFVDRGWIPHDEGTIAGDAVRLLQGELPHLGFQDPYTGGMTWFYAWLFRAFGVDLLTIRWALFAGAMVATMAWYRIGLVFGPPLAAAGVALTCLVWSFPNYFAGLPSWWVLIFASLAVLALMRFSETRREAWVFAAGLLLGIACTFKQTGAYLVAAGWLTVAYAERCRRKRPVSSVSRSRVGLALRLLAAGTIIAGLVLLARVHSSARLWLLLMLPLLAATVFVPLDEWQFGAEGRVTPLLRLSGVFVVGVALPLAVLASPYAIAGRLDAFFNGAFVLPQSRGTFASHDLPEPLMAIGLVPWLVAVIRHEARTGSPAAPKWLTATAALAPLAIVVAGYHFTLGYQFIWNAARFASLVVVPFALAELWRNRIQHDERRVGLFALLSIASFLTFFQFPFPAPIYYCYAAPLVVLAAFAACQCARIDWRYSSALCASAALFAVLSLNRGYADTIGLLHLPARFDTRLTVPRAGVRMPHEMAVAYERVTALARQHGRGEFVHAFPDCPEVYFLAGRRNPTPANFDFFLPMTDSDLASLWDTHGVTVVVVNQRPSFSPRLSGPRLALVRRTFPEGEQVGHFEVRWRTRAPDRPGDTPGDSQSRW